MEPFRAEDRALLRELICEYHAYDGHEVDEVMIGAALDHLCAETPLARAWIFRDETGKAAGYASIALGFSIETGGPDFFLDEIYLRAAWRGRGCGTRLLERIEEACRALGARRLCLEAVFTNEAARRLYARAGYREHERHLMSKVL